MQIENVFSYTRNYFNFIINLDHKLTGKTILCAKQFKPISYLLEVDHNFFDIQIFESLFLEMEVI